MKVYKRRKKVAVRCECCRSVMFYAKKPKSGEVRVRRYNPRCVVCVQRFGPSGPERLSVDFGPGTCDEDKLRLLRELEEKYG